MFQVIPATKRLVRTPSAFLPAKRRFPRKEPFLRPKRSGSTLRIPKSPWLTFEQFKDAGGVPIDPELMGYIQIPYNWKDFNCHKG